MKAMFWSVVLLAVVPLGCRCACRRPIPHASVPSCPPDSVKVGPTCVDKYEASVWRIPPSNVALIEKVKQGTATLSDLKRGEANLAQPADNCGAGIQLDTAGFPRHGNWTSPFYAVSVAGVYPTACISWFQAAQACALAGKRLLTNQEWQIAAAGTVDPGENDGTPPNTKCNTGVPAAKIGTPRQTGHAGSTAGAADSCISRWGVEDMVGNLDEWVGDWDERSDLRTAFRFPPDFGDGNDASKIGKSPSLLCLGGAKDAQACTHDADCPGSCTGGVKVGKACTTDAECPSSACGPPGKCGLPAGEPAAYQRGGNYGFGASSGVFALSVGGGSELWSQHPYFGFRCAR